MYVRYRTSEQDFVSAGAFMLRKKNGLPPRWGGWVAALFLCGLPVLAFLQLSWARNLLPVALLVGIFCFGIPLLTRTNMGRQYRGSPLHAEITSLQADFSGLHVRSHSSSWDAAWSVFEAYAEDRQSFLVIRQGNMIFIPIPKRTLTQPQIEAIRCTLDTYLPRV